MTIHPLLRLVVSQPKLLADHAEAYAELVGKEVSVTAKAYGIRAAAGAAAFLMALIFLILAAVALMLWAATSPGSMRAPWALVVVPAVPAVIAVIGVLIAMKKTDNPFVELRQQFAADVSMIRQATAA